jgi:hypothetical protein
MKYIKNQEPKETQKSILEMKSTKKTITQKNPQNATKNSQNATKTFLLSNLHFNLLQTCCCKISTNVPFIAFSFKLPQIPFSF